MKFIVTKSMAKNSLQILVIETIKHNKCEAVRKFHIKLIRKLCKMLFNSSDKFNMEIQQGKERWDNIFTAFLFVRNLFYYDIA